MTSRYLKAVRLAVIAAPAALLMGCAAPAGDQTLQSDVAALKSDMQKVLKGIDDLKAADKQQVDRMDLINKYAESAATKADAAEKAAEAAMAEAKKGEPEGGRGVPQVVAEVTATPGSRPVFGGAS